MQCNKCNSILCFVNTDCKNGLVGYWKCFKCDQQIEEADNRVIQNLKESITKESLGKNLKLFHGTMEKEKTYAE